MLKKRLGNHHVGVVLLHFFFFCLLSNYLCLLCGSRAQFQPALTEAWLEVSGTSRSHGAAKREQLGAAGVNIAQRRNSITFPVSPWLASINR